GGQQVIVVQPANPQVVYVPTYNPTVIYGTPYYPPGYSTGALVATSIISFGAGLAIGAALSGGYGWGWNSWGCGWHGGSVTYNRNVYVSNSNVYRNGGNYGGNAYNRSGNRNTNISGNTVNVNTGNRNTVNNANRNTNVNSGNRNNNINSSNRNPNNNVASGNRPNAGNQPNAGNRPTQAPAADRGYGQKPATGTKSDADIGDVEMCAFDDADRLVFGTSYDLIQAVLGVLAGGIGAGHECKLRPSPQTEITDHGIGKIKRRNTGGEYEAALCGMDAGREAIHGGAVLHQRRHGVADRD